MTHIKASLGFTAKLKLKTTRKPTKELEVNMSPLTVQLLLSLLIIVFAVAMMVYMYQYARKKMLEEKLQREPVEVKENE